jgi:hypothetical protein
MGCGYVHRSVWFAEASPGPPMPRGYGDTVADASCRPGSSGRHAQWDAGWLIDGLRWGHRGGPGYDPLGTEQAQDPATQPCRRGRRSAGRSPSARGPWGGPALGVVRSRLEPDTTRPMPVSSASAPHRHWATSRWTDGTTARGGTRRGDAGDQPTHLREHVDRAPRGTAGQNASRNAFPILTVPRRLF